MNHLVRAAVKHAMPSDEQQQKALEEMIRDDPEQAITIIIETALQVVGPEVLKRLK